VLFDKTEDLFHFRKKVGIQGETVNDGGFSLKPACLKIAYQAIFLYKKKVSSKSQLTAANDF
jgi:hypothetical protein